MISTALPPPTSKKSFDISEVYLLLKDLTKCDNIILYDESYDSIELEDVKRFCTYNTNLKYKPRRFDCDDQSFSFMTRFREWAYDMNGDNGILCGFIAGDIKLKESDPSRPHGVCFFIDSEKRLYIVDAMYNEIYDYQTFMSCWSIIL